MNNLIHLNKIQTVPVMNEVDWFKNKENYPNVISLNTSQKIEEEIFHFSPREMKQYYQEKTVSQYTKKENVYHLSKNKKLYKKTNTFINLLKFDAYVSFEIMLISIMFFMFLFFMGKLLINFI